MQQPAGALNCAVWCEPLRRHKARVGPHLTTATPCHDAVASARIPVAAGLLAADVNLTLPAGGNLTVGAGLFVAKSFAPRDQPLLSLSTPGRPCAEFTESPAVDPSDVSHWFGGYRGAADVANTLQLRHSRDKGSGFASLGDTPRHRRTPGETASVKAAVGAQNGKPPRPLHAVAGVISWPTRQIGLEPMTYGLEAHRCCHTASPRVPKSHGFTTFPSPSVTTRHPAARGNCKRICENFPARASGRWGDM